MAANVSRLFAVAALLCLLLAAAPTPSAAITCGQVASGIASCLAYVRGAGPLTAACCNGVRNLNTQSRTTADRQTVCNCLKTVAASAKFNPALAAGLPGKCGVNVGYPISTSTDCSKVR